MRVELIYFEGCPHADRARANVRAALAAAGLQLTVKEWERDAAAAPGYVRRYPSPTVLVNGRDVAGSGEENDAASCRTGGAPSVDVILRALSG